MRLLTLILVFFHSTHVFGVLPIEVATAFPERYPLLVPDQIPLVPPFGVIDLQSSFFGALTAGQVPALSALSIPALPGHQVPNVNRVTSLSSSQIPAVIPVQVPALSSSQFQFLAPNSVPSGSPIQLPSLSGVQVPILSPTLVAALSASQLPALAPSQLIGVSPLQIPALGATELPAAVTPSNLLGLVPRQFPALSGVHVPVVPPSHLPLLAPQQVPAIAPETVHDGILTQGQMAFLAPQQVPAVPPARVPLLTAAHIADALSAAQAAAVAGSFVPLLGPTVVPALVPQQIPALRGVQVPTISPHQVPVVGEGAIPAVAAQHVPLLSRSRLPLLQPAQVPAVGPWQVELLSPAAVAAVGAAQAPLVGGEAVPNLRSDIVPAIDPLQVPALSVALIPALSPRLVAHVAGPSVAALAGTQVPILVPQQTPLLAPRQAPALSSAQIALLSSQDVAAALTVDQLSDVTSKGVPLLSPSQVPHMTTSRRPSLSAAQVPLLAPSALGDLSPAQLPALSARQVPNVGPIVVPALSGHQVPFLAPVTFPAVPPSFIPAAAPVQVTDGAVAPSAIPAVGPYHIPILSASQLPAASPSQVATAIAPIQVPAVVPVQIPALPPSLLGALSGSQIGALTGDQVPTLPPVVIPALAPAAVPAVNPTQLSGLGAAQVPLAAPRHVAQLEPVLVPAASSAQVPLLSPLLVSGAISNVQVPALIGPIAQLIQPALIPSVAPWQLPALAPRQLPAITVDTVIQAAGGAQVPALTPHQLGVVVDKQVPAVLPALVPVLAASAVPAVSPLAIPTLSAAQIPAASPAQVDTLIHRPLPAPPLVPSVPLTNTVRALAPHQVPLIAQPAVIQATGLPATAATLSPTQAAALAFRVVPPAVTPLAAGPYVDSPAYIPALPAAPTHPRVPPLGAFLAAVDDQTVPLLRPSVLILLPPAKVPTLAPTLLPAVAARPELAPTLQAHNVPAVAPEIVPLLAPVVLPTLSPAQVPLVRGVWLPTDVPVPSTTQRIPVIAATGAPALIAALSDTQLPALPPGAVPLAVQGAPVVTPALPAAFVPLLNAAAVPTIAPAQVPALLDGQIPAASAAHVTVIAGDRLPLITPRQVPATVPLQTPALAPVLVEALSKADGLDVVQIPLLAPHQPPLLVPAQVPALSPLQIATPAGGVIGGAATGSVLSAELISAVRPSRVPLLPPSALPFILPETIPTLAPHHVPALRGPHNYVALSPQQLVELDMPRVVPVLTAEQVKTLTPRLVPLLSATQAPWAAPSQIPAFIGNPHLIPAFAGGMIPAVPPDFLPNIAKSAIPAVSSSQLHVLPPDDLVYISPVLVPDVLPAQVAYVAPWHIEALRDSQVPHLPPARVPIGVPAVVPALSPAQTAATSPRQFAALRPGQVPIVSPDAVAYVPPVLVPSMSPEQTSVLFTPAQLAALASSQVPLIMPSAVPALNPSHLAALTPQLVPNVQPRQIISISPAQVPILEPSVVRNVPPAHVPSLSPTQVTVVAPRQLAALGDHQVPLLPPSIVNDAPPQVIPALSGALVGALLPRQLAYVSGDQVPTFLPHQVVDTPPQLLASLSVPQVSLLLPRSIKDLSPLLVPAVGAGAVVALAPVQVPVLSPQQLPALTPTQVGAASADQVAILEPRQLPQLVASQVPAITNAQLPLLIPAQVPAVTAAQVPVVPTALVDALSGTLVPNVRPRQVAALIPDQVPALSASLVPSVSPWQVPVVSGALIPATLPQQIPSLSPAQTPAVSMAQVPVVAPHAVPTLSRVQVPALPPQGIPTISAAQVPAVSTAQVPLLSSSHLAVAGASQLPAVVPANLPLLPPLHIPNVAPARLPQIAPWHVPVVAHARVPILADARVPDTAPQQTPSLSAAQVPALAPTRLAELAPAQVPAASPEQVPAAGPLLVPVMSAAQVPATNPAQVPNVINGQVPALLSAQVPLLSPLQSRSTSPLQVADGALAPSHVATAARPDAVPLLPPWQVPVVSPSNVPALDPAQIATSALSDVQVPVLLPRQVPLLRASMVPHAAPQQVPVLSPLQLSADISPDQVPAVHAVRVPLVSPAQVPVLIPSLVPAVAAEQVPVLAPILVPAAAAGLVPAQSPAQVPVTPPRSVPNVSPRQVPTLAPAQLGALGVTEALVQATSPAQVPALTAAQVQVVTPAHLRALDVSQIPSVRPARVPELPPSQVGSRGLSPQQLAALSPQQVPIISEAEIVDLAPHLIPTLSTAQWPAITPRLIRAITVPSTFPRLLPQQVPVLLPVQTPALPPRLVPSVSRGQVPTVDGPIIAALTPELVPLAAPYQVSRFTPTQLAAIGDLSQQLLAAITPQQVPALLPHLIPGVRVPQVPAISPRQGPLLAPNQVRAALPHIAPALSPVQVPQVGPVVVADFDELRVAAASVQQIPLLLPFQLPALLQGQVPVVAPDRVKVLQPIQVPAISPAQVDGVSHAHIPALSARPALVPVLSPAKVPLLPPAMADLTSPAQVPLLGFEALRALIPANVPRVSPVQVPHLAPHQFAALNPGHVDAVRPAFIPTLSGANVDAVAPQNVRAAAPVQVPAMTPAQLAATSHLQVPAAAPRQIPSLPPVLVQHVVPHLIPTLQLSQIPSLTPTQIGSSALTAAQVAALPPPRVTYLSDASLPLISPAQVPLVDRFRTGALQPRFVPAFSRYQLTWAPSNRVPQVTIDSELWQTLLQHEIPSLAPPSVPSFLPRYLPAASPLQQLAMSAAQLALLAPREVPAFPPSLLPRVLPQQVPVVAPVRLPVLASDQLAALSGNQIDDLLPNQIPRVPPVTVPRLNPGQHPLLSAAQAAALTDGRVVPNLAPRLVPNIAPALVPAVRPVAISALHPVHIPALSPVRAPSITPAQVAFLSPALVPVLPPVMLPALTPRLLVAVRGSQVPTLAPHLLRDLHVSAWKDLSPQQYADLSLSPSQSESDSQTITITPTASPTATYRLCRGRGDSACGNGRCDSVAGICICDNDDVRGHFMGDACDVCAYGWEGASCTERVGSGALSFCGAGVTRACICAAGFEASVDARTGATTCSQCLPSFFGPTCSTYCHPQTTCNGRGSCGSDGACACAYPFTGPSCASCVRGYYGTQCSSRCVTPPASSDLPAASSSTSCLPTAFLSHRRVVVDIPLPAGYRSMGIQLPASCTDAVASFVAPSASTPLLAALDSPTCSIAVVPSPSSRCPVDAPDDPTVAAHGAAHVQIAISIGGPTSAFLSEVMAIPTSTVVSPAQSDVSSLSVCSAASSRGRSAAATANASTEFYARDAAVAQTSSEYIYGSRVLVPAPRLGSTVAVPLTALDPHPLALSYTRAISTAGAAAPIAFPPAFAASASVEGGAHSLSGWGWSGWPPHPVLTPASAVRGDGAGVVMAVVAVSFSIRGATVVERAAVLEASVKAAAVAVAVPFTGSHANPAAAAAVVAGTARSIDAAAAAMPNPAYTVRGAARIFETPPSTSLVDVVFDPSVLRDVHATGIVNRTLVLAFAAVHESTFYRRMSAFVFAPPTATLSPSAAAAAVTATLGVANHDDHLRPLAATPLRVSRTGALFLNGHRVVVVCPSPDVICPRSAVARAVSGPPYTASGNRVAPHRPAAPKPSSTNGVCGYAPTAAPLTSLHSAAALLLPLGTTTPPTPTPAALAVSLRDVASLAGAYPVGSYTVGALLVSPHISGSASCDAQSAAGGVAGSGYTWRVAASPPRAGGTTSSPSLTRPVVSVGSSATLFDPSTAASAFAPAPSDVAMSAGLQYESAVANAHRTTNIAFADTAAAAVTGWRAVYAAASDGTSAASSLVPRSAADVAPAYTVVAPAALRVLTSPAGRVRMPQAQTGTSTSASMVVTAAAYEAPRGLLVPDVTVSYVWRARVVIPSTAAAAPVASAGDYDNATVTPFTVVPSAGLELADGRIRVSVVAATPNAVRITAVDPHLFATVEIAAHVAIAPHNPITAPFATSTTVAVVMAPGAARRRPTALLSGPAALALAEGVAPRMFEAAALAASAAVAAAIDSPLVAPATVAATAAVPSAFVAVSPVGGLAGTLPGRTGWPTAAPLRGLPVGAAAAAAPAAPPAGSGTVNVGLLDAVASTSIDFGVHDMVGYALRIPAYASHAPVSMSLLRGGVSMPVHAVGGAASADGSNAGRPGAVLQPHGSRDPVTGDVWAGRAVVLDAFGCAVPVRESRSSAAYPDGAVGGPAARGTRVIVRRSAGAAMAALEDDLEGYVVPQAAGRLLLARSVVVPDALRAAVAHARAASGHAAIVDRVASPPAGGSLVQVETSVATAAAPVLNVTDLVAAVHASCLRTAPPLAFSAPGRVSYERIPVLRSTSGTETSIRESAETYSSRGGAGLATASSDFLLSPTLAGIRLPHGAIPRPSLGVDDGAAYFIFEVDARYALQDLVVSPPLLGEALYVRPGGSGTAALLIVPLASVVADVDGGSANITVSAGDTAIVVAAHRPVSVAVAGSPNKTTVALLPPLVPAAPRPHALSAAAALAITVAGGATVVAGGSSVTLELSGLPHGRLVYAEEVMCIDSLPSPITQPLLPDLVPAGAIPVVIMGCPTDRGPHATVVRVVDAVSGIVATLSLLVDSPAPHWATMRPIVRLVPSDRGSAPSASLYFPALAVAVSASSAAFTRALEPSPAGDPLVGAAAVSAFATAVEDGDFVAAWAVARRHLLAVPPSNVAAIAATLPLRRSPTAWVAAAALIASATEIRALLFVDVDPHTTLRPQSAPTGAVGGSPAAPLVVGGQALGPAGTYSPMHALLASASADSRLAAVAAQPYLRASLAASLQAVAVPPVVTMLSGVDLSTASQSSAARAARARNATAAAYSVPSHAMTVDGSASTARTAVPHSVPAGASGSAAHPILQRAAFSLVAHAEAIGLPGAMASLPHRLKALLLDAILVGAAHPTVTSPLRPLFVIPAVPLPAAYISSALLARAAAEGRDISDSRGDGVSPADVVLAAVDASATTSATLHCVFADTTARVRLMETQRNGALYVLCEATFPPAVGGPDALASAADGSGDLTDSGRVFVSILQWGDTDTGDGAGTRETTRGAVASVEIDASAREAAVAQQSHPYTLPLSLRAVLIAQRAAAASWPAAPGSGTAASPSFVQPYSPPEPSDPTTNPHPMVVIAFHDAPSSLRDPPLLVHASCSVPSCVPALANGGTVPSCVCDLGDTATVEALAAAPLALLVDVAALSAAASRMRDVDDMGHTPLWARILAAVVLVVAAVILVVLLCVAPLSSGVAPPSVDMAVPPAAACRTPWLLPYVLSLPGVIPAPSGLSAADLQNNEDDSSSARAARRSRRQAARAAAAAADGRASPSAGGPFAADPSRRWRDDDPVLAATRSRTGALHDGRRVDLGALMSDGDGATDVSNSDMDVMIELVSSGAAGLPLLPPHQLADPAVAWELGRAVDDTLLADAVRALSADAEHGAHGLPTSVHGPGPARIGPDRGAVRGGKGGAPGTSADPTDIASTPLVAAGRRRKSLASPYSVPPIVGIGSMDTTEASFLDALPDGPPPLVVEPDGSPGLRTPPADGRAGDLTAAPRRSPSLAVWAHTSPHLAQPPREANVSQSATAVATTAPPAPDAIPHTSSLRSMDASNAPPTADGAAPTVPAAPQGAPPAPAAAVSQPAAPDRDSPAVQDATIPTATDALAQQRTMLRRVGTALNLRAAADGATPPASATPPKPSAAPVATSLAKPDRIVPRYAAQVARIGDTEADDDATADGATMMSLPNNHRADGSNTLHRKGSLRVAPDASVHHDGPLVSHVGDRRLSLDLQDVELMRAAATSRHVGVAVHVGVPSSAAVFVHSVAAAATAARRSAWGTGIVLAASLGWIAVLVWLGMILPYAGHEAAVNADWVWSPDLEVVVHRESVDAFAGSAWVSAAAASASHYCGSGPTRWHFPEFRCLGEDSFAGRVLWPAGIARRLAGRWSDSAPWGVMHAAIGLAVALVFFAVILTIAYVVALAAERAVARLLPRFQSTLGRVDRFAFHLPTLPPPPPMALLWGGEHGWATANALALGALGACGFGGTAGGVADAAVALTCVAALSRTRESASGRLVAADTTVGGAFVRVFALLWRVVASSPRSAPPMHHTLLEAAAAIGAQQPAAETALVCKTNARTEAVYGPHGGDRLAQRRLITAERRLRRLARGMAADAVPLRFSQRDSERLSLIAAAAVRGAVPRPMAISMSGGAGRCFVSSRDLQLAILAPTSAAAAAATTSGTPPRWARNGAPHLSRADSAVGARRAVGPALPPSVLPFAILRRPQPAAPGSPVRSPSPTRGALQEPCGFDDGAMLGGLGSGAHEDAPSLGSDVLATPTSPKAQPLRTRPRSGGWPSKSSVDNASRGPDKRPVVAAAPTSMGARLAAANGGLAPLVLPHGLPMSAAAVASLGAGIDAASPTGPPMELPSFVRVTQRSSYPIPYPQVRLPATVLSMSSPLSGRRTLSGSGADAGSPTMATAPAVNPPSPGHVTIGAPLFALPPTAPLQAPAGAAGGAAGLVMAPHSTAGGGGGLWGSASLAGASANAREATLAAAAARHDALRAELLLLTARADAVENQMAGRDAADAANVAAQAAIFVPVDTSIPLRVARPDALDVSAVSHVGITGGFGSLLLSPSSRPSSWAWGGGSPRARPAESVRRDSAAETASVAWMGETFSATMGVDVPSPLLEQHADVLFAEAPTPFLAALASCSAFRRMVLRLAAQHAARWVTITKPPNREVQRGVASGAAHWEGPGSAVLRALVREESVASPLADDFGDVLAVLRGGANGGAPREVLRSAVAAVTAQLGYDTAAIVRAVPLAAATAVDILKAAAAIGIPLEAEAAGHQADVYGALTAFAIAAARPPPPMAGRKRSRSPTASPRAAAGTTAATFTNRLSFAMAAAVPEEVNPLVWLGGVWGSSALPPDAPWLAPPAAAASADHFAHVRTAKASITAAALGDAVVAVSNAPIADGFVPDGAVAPAAAWGAEWPAHGALAGTVDAQSAGPSPPSGRGVSARGDAGVVVEFDAIPGRDIATTGNPSPAVTPRVAERSAASLLATAAAGGAAGAPVASEETGRPDPEAEHVSQVRVCDLLQYIIPGLPPPPVAAASAQLASRDSGALYAAGVALAEAVIGDTARRPSDVGAFDDPFGHTLLPLSGEPRGPICAQVAPLVATQLIMMAGASGHTDASAVTRTSRNASARLGAVRTFCALRHVRASAGARSLGGYYAAWDAAADLPTWQDAIVAASSGSFVEAAEAFMWALREHPAGVAAGLRLTDVSDWVEQHAPAGLRATVRGALEDAMAAAAAQVAAAAAAGASDEEDHDDETDGTDDLAIAASVVAASGAAFDANNAAGMWLAVTSTAVTADSVPDAMRLLLRSGPWASDAGFGIRGATAGAVAAHYVVSAAAARPEFSDLVTAASAAAAAASAAEVRNEERSAEAAPASFVMISVDSSEETDAVSSSPNRSRPVPPEPRRRLHFVAFLQLALLVSIRLVTVMGSVAALVILVSVLISDAAAVPALFTAIVISSGMYLLFVALVAIVGWRVCRANPNLLKHFVSPM